MNPSFCISEEKRRIRDETGLLRKVHMFETHGLLVVFVLYHLALRQVFKTSSYVTVTVATTNLPKIEVTLVCPPHCLLFITSTLFTKFKFILISHGMYFGKERCCESS